MAWIMYNPNPVGRTVGDCSTRALAKALDVDWGTAYIMAAINGFSMGDMPSSNSVWGSVLRQHGFKKAVLPESCPDCYTVGDFAIEHPQGTYVLGTGTHVVTMIDGDIYDSWDSLNETPVYFWYKEEI